MEGVFNDFSGIVLVRKNQIGDFKVKRSAVLAFQPAQLEGHVSSERISWRGLLSRTFNGP